MFNTSPMRPFHVMAKPSGSECNLNCSYCFYLEKHALYQQQRYMDPDILELYVRNYIESTPLHNEVAFT